MNNIAKSTLAAWAQRKKQAVNGAFDGVGASRR